MAVPMSALSMVSLYEIEGLSPEQIAESQEFDVISVKVALMQHSPLFRQRQESLEKGSKSKELFDDDELLMARNAMVRLVNSEDDTVVFRASKFIIDEKKGRNDITKEIGKVQINVNLINDQMSRARKALKTSKQKLLVGNPSFDSNKDSLYSTNQQPAIDV